MATKRTVKLQPKRRPSSFGKGTIVPELRVGGHWLAKHGFKAGERIEITVRQGQLIIKPEAG